MKRDMDLLRSILIELANSSGLVQRDDPEGAFQIALILDAGLAEGAPLKNGQGIPVAGTLTRLT